MSSLAVVDEIANGVIGQLRANRRRTTQLNASFFKLVKRICGIGDESVVQAAARRRIRIVIRFAEAIAVAVINIIIFLGRKKRINGVARAYELFRVVVVKPGA